MKKIDWQNLDRSTVKVEESPVADWRSYFPKGANCLKDAAIIKADLEALRRDFNFRFDMHDPKMELAYDCHEKIFFPMPSFMVKRAKARAKADAALLANYDGRVAELKADIARCAANIANLEKRVISDTYADTICAANEALQNGTLTKENYDALKAALQSVKYTQYGSETEIAREKGEKARLEKMLTDLLEWGKAHGKNAA